MNWSEILLTIGCVVGISSGQLLFKKAAQAFDPSAGWIVSVLNGWLISALVLYGAATLLWIYVLRTAPLALAYPLFALAFMIVPVLSWMVLGEPLRPMTLAGGAIILVGVVIAVRG